MKEISEPSTCSFFVGYFKQIAILTVTLAFMHDLHLCGGTLKHKKAKSMKRQVVAPC